MIKLFSTSIRLRWLRCVRQQKFHFFFPKIVSLSHGPIESHFFPIFVSTSIIFLFVIYWQLNLKPSNDLLRVPDNSSIQDGKSQWKTMETVNGFHFPLSALNIFIACDQTNVNYKPIEMKNRIEFFNQNKLSNRLRRYKYLIIKKKFVIELREKYFRFGIWMWIFGFV